MCFLFQRTNATCIPTSSWALSNAEHAQNESNSSKSMRAVGNSDARALDAAESERAAPDAAESEAAGGFVLPRAI